MNFLIFTCAKIEQNDKATLLEARVALEQSNITGFYQMCDHDDLPITGALVIITRNNEKFTVIKDFDEMVDDIKSIVI